MASLEESNARLEAENDRARAEYEEEMKAVNQTYGEENCKLSLEVGELKRTSQAQIQHLQDELLKKIDEIETVKQSMRCDFETRIGELESQLARERDSAAESKRQMDALADELMLERKQTQDARREMGIEMKLMKSQLETATVTQTRLAEDKTRLLAQVETFNREYAELHARFCEATGEKEKLLKEIVELSKKLAERGDASSSDRQLEFQTKLEEKLDQLQSRLDKTKRMSGQFRTPGSGPSSTSMNESFIVKLDNQIETKLQNKVIFSSFSHFELVRICSY